MKAILTQDELDHLSTVIGELEAATSGEIRLMIVSRSSVAGHVRSVLWALLVVISFLVIWTIHYEFIWWPSW